MNFTFDAYNVKLTLNPSDLIIRIEHQTTKLLYESTLTVSDFPGCESIGGLKAMYKLLEKGLSQHKTYDYDDDSVRPNTVTIRIYDLSPEGLSLRLEYDDMVTISYTLIVAPKRRETSEAEIALTTFREEIEEVKEEIRYEVRRELSQLTRVAGRLQRMIESIILIPGYPVIAADLKTLTLVKEVPEANAEANTFCVKSPTDILKQYNDKQSAANHINVLKIIHTVPVEFPLIVCFTNLVNLKICHPFMTDISWITKLEELLEVDFEGCTGLFNINPLSKLTRLYSINIKDTAVKDISALTMKAGLLIKQ